MYSCKYWESRLSHLMPKLFAKLKVRGQINVLVKFLPIQHMSLVHVLNVLQDANKFSQSVQEVCQWMSKMEVDLEPLSSPNDDLESLWQQNKEIEVVYIL